MSANGNDPTPPTRSEVEAKLLDLITGRCERRQAAEWANALIQNDISVPDSGVWDAVISLSGADLPTTDRAYLYGEADFCIWLEQLKRSKPV
jgi:hypothetical protein